MKPIKAMTGKHMRKLELNEPFPNSGKRHENTVIISLTNSEMFHRLKLSHFKNLSLFHLAAPC